jgi:hypothetical protein
MNTGVLKTVIIIAVFLFVVSTAGCTDIGAQVRNYQSPNMCHGALQNLSFAKAVCRQFSAPVPNSTMNQTPATGP